MAEPNKPINADGTTTVAADTDANGLAPGEAGGATGNITANLTNTSTTAGAAAFQQRIALEDKVFTLDLKGSSNEEGKGFRDLQIDATTRKNNVTDGKPSILLNSSRVIINSREDYTIIAGEKGVSISSKAKVNLDADDTICLYGDQGLFFGVPNKGDTNKVQPSKAISETDSKYYKDGKPLKSLPTDNLDYEPIVLGLKLANWLDDLLQTLKTSVILTSLAEGSFREDVQWEFTALQSRIKEMLSTYAYVDGWTHGAVDPVTSPPTKDDLSKPNPEIVVDVSGLKIKGIPGIPAAPVLTDPLALKPDYYTTTEVGGSNDTATALTNGGGNQ